MTEITPALLAELEKIQDPGKLLAELHRRFGARMAVASSGQPTETAMIAMAVKEGVKPRVYTLDTWKLFPETLAHFKEIEAAYGVAIERLTPDKAETEAMVKEHGEFLFFDSKEKQELCCRVRKVHPNERMLDGLDAWVTGLRADQSPGRADLPRLEIIQHKGRAVLKAQPLVDWTEARLRAYMRDNKVPVHPLMKSTLPGGFYYESLGCVVCTTPIGPNEPRRAGRWRWFNQAKAASAEDDAKKECGLHVPSKDA